MPNNLSYVNVLSHSPPNVIKCLPNSINNLLSQNSSNIKIFDIKEDYQKAFYKSGFKIKLFYKGSNNNSKENNNKNKTETM